MDNNEDKIYTLRKFAVMLTCLIVFVTVGLVVVSFQSKKIVIDYYGQKIEVTTMSNTIEGLLMQNGIYVDETAVVYPSRDTILTNNMEVVIYSETNTARLDISRYLEMASKTVVEKYVNEQQTIPYDSLERSNATKARGVVQTVQEGTKGKQNVEYTVKYVNGVEVSQNIINKTVISEPISQIIEVGTLVTTVSRSSSFRVNASDLAVDENFKYYKVNLSADLQKYAYNMCKKYGINYELMLALMYCESGFNASAHSSTNDYGICQINGSNYTHLANNLGVTNLYDPYQNIRSGVYWLSRYMKSWASSATTEEQWLHALNSYNFGEGGYRNYLSYNNRDEYSWYYGTKVLATRTRLIQNGAL